MERPPVAHNETFVAHGAFQVLQHDVLSWFETNKISSSDGRSGHSDLGSAIKDQHFDKRESLTQAVDCLGDQTIGDQGGEMPSLCHDTIDQVVGAHGG